MEWHSPGELRLESVFLEMGGICLCAIAPPCVSSSSVRQAHIDVAAALLGHRLSLGFCKTMPMWRIPESGESSLPSRQFPGEETSHADLPPFRR